MRYLPKVQINPTSRVASVLHVAYLVMLPLIVLVLVRAKFVEAAFAIVVLSKWRMFAVRPRYWLANLRANMVDITVGLSVVVFMSHTTSIKYMLIWAAVYGIWLVFIKPSSSGSMVGVQAFVAQGLGLSALFNNYSTASQVFLVVFTWAVCFGAARHFLVSSEDVSNRPLSHLWAVFAAEMALILGHWSVVYGGFLPQVVLVLSAVGYGLGVGYYIHRTKGLSSGTRQQLIFGTIVVLVMVIVLTDWQSKTF
jgi:hypothetical protein